eukprot:TRINITY_DN467_c5_g2_i2.p1 TRINITY_DN467_c5_g2~~TRINITY_DN467_c5_g2_i2.p1  ORF type:complete len:277 (+),score=57.36 TRINITY_DN467_c5_g2_i2:111-941(+)
MMKGYYYDCYIFFFLFLISLNFIFCSCSSSNPNINNNDDESSYSIAVISDMHIGESPKQTTLAEECVTKINSLIEKNNIKFVIITGDLSNSALPKQFLEAKSILDELKVPYLPILGNHDVWTYNSTLQTEEREPTGDQLFASIFAENFNSFPFGDLVYKNVPVWNPFLNITCHFQNWELYYQNTLFYGLDWSSREHAVTALGYQGSMPGTRNKNFEGGTFNWLEERLNYTHNHQTTYDSNQIILLQHHPFHMPFDFIPPGFIYSFGAVQKYSLSPY